MAKSKRLQLQSSVPNQTLTRFENEKTHLQNSRFFSVLPSFSDKIEISFANGAAKVVMNFDSSRNETWIQFSAL